MKKPLALKPTQVARNYGFRNYGVNFYWDQDTQKKIIRAFTAGMRHQQRKKNGK